MKKELTMEKLVAYCKQYGFIYQGSEIYGGLANTWDYGPLGSRMKNNLKDAWRKRFIQEKRNSYEIDPSILMHPKVWEASGHVDGFSDPLIDCKSCKSRHRVDKMLEEAGVEAADALTPEEMMKKVYDLKIKCPKCGEGEFTDIRQFNLLFETYRGVTEDSKIKIYLRPENAQGEYVNFLNVLRSSRCKLPFGIGQIGKAFRNEITPGNFTFRTVEFEQMEYQTFCNDKTDTDLYEHYKKFGKKFYMDLGIKEENLDYHDHDKLVFYAKAACDIMYKFPWGYDEINGTHNRTNYDLTQHQNYSGVSMEYLDPETNEKYIPYIIESTYGVDRSILALLCEAYEEEEMENETREVLRLHPYIAPYKVAVLPLMKKYHSEKAEEVYELLSKEFMTTYDDAGSIGKRYRRNDAIGTPFCITVDDNTLSDNKVTIRDRDTMEQITLDISEVPKYVAERIKF